MRQVVTRQRNALDGYRSRPHITRRHWICCCCDWTHCSGQRTSEGPCTPDALRCGDVRRRTVTQRNATHKLQRNAYGVNEPEDSPRARRMPLRVGVAMNLDRRVSYPILSIDCQAFEDWIKLSAAATEILFDALFCQRWCERCSALFAQQCVLCTVYPIPSLMIIIYQSTGGPNPSPPGLSLVTPMRLWESTSWLCDCNKGIVWAFNHSEITYFFTPNLVAIISCKLNLASQCRIFNTMTIKPGVSQEFLSRGSKQNTNFKPRFKHETTAAIGGSIPTWAITITITITI